MHAPPATSKTIPNHASRGGLAMTGGRSGTQYNVPGNILRIVPIKTIDMTATERYYGRQLIKSRQQDLISSYMLYFLKRLAVRLPSLYMISNLHIPTYHQILWILQEKCFSHY